MILKELYGFFFLIFGKTVNMPCVYEAKVKLLTSAFQSHVKIKYKSNHSKKSRVLIKNIWNLWDARKRKKLNFCVTHLKAIRDTPLIACSKRKKHKIFPPVQSDLCIHQSISKNFTCDWNSVSAKGQHLKALNKLLFSRYTFPNFELNLDFTLVNQSNQYCELLHI